jgi:hypothetical protein
MHPHVITDGSTQQPVQVHESASDEGPPVLGGNHHQVGVYLFRCRTKPSADVTGSVHGLNLDSELTSALLGFFEKRIDRVVAATAWSQVVVADVHAMEHATFEVF